MPKAFSQSAGRAQAVRLTTPTEEAETRRVSVVGSKSLSDLSFTPHPDVQGLTFVNRGTADIHISFVGGTAGTSHAAIPAGGDLVVECGRKKSVFIRLYSASAQNVDIFQSIVIQDVPYTTTTTT